MKIAIISNEFPPLMSSGSVQVRDLAAEFANKGHDVTVITATYGLKDKCLIEKFMNFEVARFPALETKEVNYFKRTINEILTPLLMLRGIKKSALANSKWDGVIWYSPTIFLAPVASYLKGNSNCPGYLILRDIFPDWAVDMGLITKGIPYKILKIFEKKQYSVADIIGVQAHGNLSYFDNILNNKHTKIEVLNNWLAHTGSKKSSLQISGSKLSGRKIFIYAGNMGVAQGIDMLFKLPLLLRDRQDIGFVFVGRGSEMEKYKMHPDYQNLDNIIFHNQIDADEIPSLYDQCHIGMLSLDIRHKTHNIPGKFLSYIASGLPVLASVNPQNDLISLIEGSNTGKVISNGSITSFLDKANALIDSLDEFDINLNCKKLSKDLFQPSSAVNQIKESIENYNLNKI
jgi:glycosyltransferase involved in cell wall biosynthesis